MTEKTLMKISKATFGIGGYQDAMIGLHLTFSSNSSGIGTSECTWSPSLISVSAGTKWTEADRDTNFAKIMRFLDKLLFDAKKDDVSKLVGTPVEVTTESNCFKSFRVLTEVL